MSSGRFRVVLVMAGLTLLGAATPAPAPLDVGAGERLLVVAPHPDDETLGAGGLMQRVLANGGSVHILLFTAGDGYVEAVEKETGRPRPRPAEFVAYGERRLAELRAAIRELSGGQVRLEVLGFPDGGLEPLLHAQHWLRSHPERSPTTRATEPPYPEALDPSAAYDGADLLHAVERTLRTWQPTTVVLPDPLDAHPDHRAAGLFTLLALDAVTRRGDGPAAPLPRMLAYLVHWPGWPGGRGGAPPAPRDTPLELPSDLAPERRRLALTLDDGERAVKERALSRHASQQEAMGPFLAAFVRRTEPFTELTREEFERISERIERRIRELRRPEK